LLKPSIDLYYRILAAIQREKNLAKIKRNLILSGLFLFASGLSLIFLGREFYLESIKSGWFSFAGLIFVDNNAVMLNFIDFILSVIESLPAITLTATLLLLVMTALALRLILSAYNSLRINLRT